MERIENRPLVAMMKFRFESEWSRFESFFDQNLSNREINMKRKILMPVVTPKPIERPRNALQEAIDRALKPQKTELQKKADEYADRNFDELCLDVKRYEHLDDGLILFLYSNFSICKIRERPNGLFEIDTFQTTRCPQTTIGCRTVADDFNEKWAAEHANKSDPQVVIEQVKKMAFNWN